MMRDIHGLFDAGNVMVANCGMPRFARSTGAVAHRHPDWKVRCADEFG
jgi:hypothetical protein